MNDFLDYLNLGDDIKKIYIDNYINIICAMHNSNILMTIKQKNKSHSFKTQSTIMKIFNLIENIELKSNLNPLRPSQEILINEKFINQIIKDKGIVITYNNYQYYIVDNILINNILKELNNL